MPEAPSQSNKRSSLSFKAKDKPPLLNILSHRLLQVRACSLITAESAIISAIADPSGKTASSSAARA